MAPPKAALLLTLLFSLLVAKPKMAILIDDAGYSLQQCQTVASWPASLNVAVIPGIRHSRECAQVVKDTHQELLLHFPWAYLGGTLASYPIRIESNASAEQIKRMLQRAELSVPGYRGINNHMGSKISLEEATLSRFMKQWKESTPDREVYFIDSRTHSKSLAYRVAERLGIVAARNELFLDGVQNSRSIEWRFSQAIAMAKKKGSVIVICHLGRKVTRQVMPLLIKKYRSQVQFVFLSDLLNGRL